MFFCVLFCVHLEVPFFPVLPVSSTALLYLKTPGFWSFALSDKSNKKMTMIMEHWWNNTARVKWNYPDETCPNAVLSTTNHTWVGPESNPHLCDEGTVTKNLNHCTAFSCQFLCANPAEITRSFTKFSPKSWQHTGLCENCSENVV